MRDSRLGIARESGQVGRLDRRCSGKHGRRWGLGGCFGGAAAGWHGTHDWPHGCSDHWADRRQGRRGHRRRSECGGAMGGSGTGGGAATATGIGGGGNCDCDCDSCGGGISCGSAAAAASGATCAAKAGSIGYWATGAGTGETQAGKGTPGRIATPTLLMSVAVGGSGPLRRLLSGGGAATGGGATVIAGSGSMPTVVMSNSVTSACSGVGAAGAGATAGEDGAASAASSDSSGNRMYSHIGSTPCATAAGR
jgi:hypothetical protein